MSTLTRREFGALSASLLLSASSSATAEVGQVPELIVDIDVNDEVWLRPEPMTEADVERVCHRLHDLLR